MSLRTNLPEEALRRSVILRDALGRGERQVMQAHTDGSVSEAQVSAMLGEMVRATILEIIEQQEQASPDESGAALAEIAARRDTVTGALRTRDWTAARAVAGTAAETCAVPEDSLAEPAVARQILLTMRRLLDIAEVAERDVEDPLREGRDLLREFDLPARREALRPPMCLTEATRKAADSAPREVAKKITTLGRVAVERFGDVPVASLSFDDVVGFLEFIWWLPKHWGRAHGKNRFTSEGRDLTAADYRAEADAKDAALVEQVFGDARLSHVERRRVLQSELTPRLTDSYVMVLRDHLQRIFRAALGNKRVGRHVEDEDRVVPSHTQMRAFFRQWHEATRRDGIPTRIAQPKRRRSWSLERLHKLFRSPLYQGSASLARRSRPGYGKKRVIKRDALYWVPLIMVTMGMRPEEILPLPLEAVRRRNGILCLFVGEGELDPLKAEQSRRVLPIPQLLLDLGFLDWVKARLRAGETLMFPEIEPDASHKRQSQMFGDRLRTYLGRAGLRSSEEDIHALRRTLATRLLHAHCDPGVRQRILGHLEGTTIDRHYSDDALHELKAMLDLVEYGVTAGRDPDVAFPVIAGFAAGLLPEADAEVVLDAKGAVTAVRVTEVESDRVLFLAQLEGAEASDHSDWAGADVLSKAEMANRVLGLMTTHELSLPAAEEHCNAFEHLLIHGDVEVTTFEDRVKSAQTARSGPGEIDRPETDTAGSETAAPEGDPSRGTARSVDHGSVVLCHFPLPRSGGAPAGPRPRLVVGLRSLHGRDYYDIAASAPADNRPLSGSALAVTDLGDIGAAGLRYPTVFNLKRRVLVPADGHPAFGGRLGRLTARRAAELRERLLALGDACPSPIDELMGSGRKIAEVVRRPGKRIGRGAGRRVRDPAEP